MLESRTYLYQVLSNAKAYPSFGWVPTNFGLHPDTTRHIERGWSFMTAPTCYRSNRRSSSGPNPAQRLTSRAHAPSRNSSWRSRAATVDHEAAPSVPALRIGQTAGFRWSERVGCRDVDFAMLRGCQRRVETVTAELDAPVDGPPNATTPRALNTAIGRRPRLAQGRHPSATDGPRLETAPAAGAPAVGPSAERHSHRPLGPVSLASAGNRPGTTRQPRQRRTPLDQPRPVSKTRHSHPPGSFPICRN